MNAAQQQQQRSYVKITTEFETGVEMVNKLKEINYS